MGERSRRLLWGKRGNVRGHPVVEYSTALLPRGIHARGTFPVAVAPQICRAIGKGAAVRPGAGMNHPGILTAAPLWKLVAAVNLWGGDGNRGGAPPAAWGFCCGDLAHCGTQGVLQFEGIW